MFSRGLWESTPWSWKSLGATKRTMLPGSSKHNSTPVGVQGRDLQRGERERPLRDSNIDWTRRIPMQARIFWFTLAQYEVFSCFFFLLFVVFFFCLVGVFSSVWFISTNVTLPIGIQRGHHLQMPRRYQAMWEEEDNKPAIEKSLHLTNKSFQTHLSFFFFFFCLRKGDGFSSLSFFHNPF